MEVKSIIKGFIAGLALSIYPYAGGLWQLPHTLGQQIHNHLILCSNMIFIAVYYYFVLYSATLTSIATKENIETSKKHFLANVGIASYMITYFITILAMSLMFLFSDYENAYKSNTALSHSLLMFFTFWVCATFTDEIINKLLLVINKK